MGVFSVKRVSIGAVSYALGGKMTNLRASGAANEYHAAIGEAV